MKKEYIGVNTNKLHDELIANGISPLLVENFEEKTWVTFDDDVNMELVQQIIDAHDPTPKPLPLSEIDKLRLENAQANAELFEMMLMLTGGVF